MQDVLLYAAILACPLGMGLMMLFMAKGMRMGASKKEEPEVERQTLGELDRRDGRHAAPAGHRD